MRRLFQTAEPAHDLRPTVLSVVALMLLLLPLTLLSTSVDRRTGLPIGLSGGESERIAGDGPVEQIRILSLEEGFSVEASVRTTDVRASAGEVELQRMGAASLTELQGVLARLKRIDPGRREATLVPQAHSTTHQVVRWMDAIGEGPSGELYPKVVLEVAQ